VAALTAPRSIDQVGKLMRLSTVLLMQYKSTHKVTCNVLCCRHTTRVCGQQLLLLRPSALLHPLLLLLQLFSDAFSRDSQLLVADPTQHTHLAAALMMRGRLSMSDAQRNISRLRPQLRMAHWNTEVGARTF
jgi:hypothetical protein